MIVHDPSRVKVASLDSFSPDVSGKRLLEYVEEAGAVAGINGGGFQDLNGVGNGGMPLGLVIRDGKLLAGGLNSATSVIGFDNENHLVVGTMTGQEALDRGIRDALSFGPVVHRKRRAGGGHRQRRRSEPPHRHWPAGGRRGAAADHRRPTAPEPGRQL